MATAVHMQPSLFDNDEAGGDDEDVKKFMAPIPMIDTYKPVQGDFENDTDRYKADMKNLPDALTNEEMNVDIGSFALAMMKGMKRRDGSQWKEGEGLGSGGGGMVEAMVAVPKQKGAGLGSEASNLVERNKKLSNGETHRGQLVAQGNKPRNYVGVSEKLVKRKIVEKGAKVVITAGPHEGEHAIIFTMEETGSAPRKDDKITIQLLCSGATLTIPYGAVRLYTHTDDTRKRYQDTEEDQQAVLRKKRRPTAPLTWVIQPGILVRYITKGEHYNKKYPVLDVTSPYDFTLKTLNGVLEGVTESEVETVIPREPGAKLLVLTGKKKGQEGMLVKRQKEKEKVVVRFSGSHTKTYTFTYYEVCSL
eukprot:TRINITY_DN2473_c1_g3_i1.p1 TRINITY_DN2473_c1_g3~~TRINITY_DN2473_c1_g3_i1.p1  ORF type:complete len:363 (+),score=44.84 TRINITY_DN2473_c1_g3_i1:48-1136(+)